ncbi:MAG TPA: type 4a pilus biogenesis protein PilO [Oligoflexia bacterium]|nr:type 4a pilus biogenesis protein PilO [Oligoflexia bacterium]HMR25735.1 type 4a pilus biogenesis protein PilO [Oligoflexia bacterium]
MNQFLAQFEKQPKALKMGVLCFLLLVILFVEYQFFISSRNAEIDKNQKEISKLEKEYSESQAIADNLESFIAQVAFLDEELKRALLLLPNEEDIQGVLRAISKEANVTNVRLISFKPQNRANKGFYASLTMTIKFEGSFHDIAKFIDRVGKLKRIINVSDIVFERVADKSLTVTAKATTYMFGGNS